MSIIPSVAARTIALGAFLLFSASIAHAQSVGSKDASGRVSIGTASILAAPGVSVEGSARGQSQMGAVVAIAGASFVVAGIGQLSADSAEVTIESVGGAAKVSVQVAASAVRSAGISVGSAVQAVTASTGTVLVASGKVLAFIPNTLGEALLHHERVPG